MIRRHFIWMACDNAVLMSGAAVADPFEQLVEVASEIRGAAPVATAAVAMAGAIPIERRVRSILNPRTWRAPIGRWRTIGLAICMAGLVVMVAVCSPASGDEKLNRSTSAVEPREPAIATPADADRPITAALNHPTTIHLQKVSPDDALLALSETSGFPIAFDKVSFEISGAEISPSVTVQANGEPLGSVLRSLAQSAIGGTKIGISVVAEGGALQISAEEAADKPKRRDEPTGGPARSALGTVQSANGKPAGNCAIVARLRSRIVFLHADAKGRFSIPLKTGDFLRFPMIVRSADGSEMAAQEVDGPLTNVTLERTKSVSLLVTDGNGQPIPQAHAAVAEVHYGYFRLDRAPFSGYTDGFGKFTVRLPEKFQIGYAYAFKSGAGLDYHSYVAPRNNADVHAKAPPQPDGPVRLVLAGSRRVTIKCIDDDGKPVSGFLVAPNCFNFTKPGETSVLGPNPSYAVTNERGEAIFDWIPTWQQEVAHFEASPRTVRANNGEQLKFDPEKPTDQFIITIHRSIVLSGTVRDAAGKPVAGAKVELTGRGYGQRRFEGRMTSGDRGQYQFEVPPLEVYMLAASTDDRRQASPIRDGIAVYPQKPVVGFDLTLAPTTRVFGRVTVGPHNEPAVNYRVRAASESRGTERIPDPDFPHGRREYLAWRELAEGANTDTEGRFRFRLAPGQYQFFAGQRGENGGMTIDPAQDDQHPIVKISGENQLEVNLHCNAPLKPVEFGVLHGTVVNGSTPVPGALVDGASQPAPNFNAVADDHGAFDIRVPNAPAVVFAKSKDGSLAGVVRVGVGRRNISVPIGPSATCTMRLLHNDKKPYSSNRTVVYHVDIPMDPTGDSRGSHWAAGGEVHPDRDGRLLLPGLVVGETYEICLRDADSRNNYSPLKTVRPQKPGDNSLSDIIYDDPKPYSPPTLDERIGRVFGVAGAAVGRNHDAIDFARLADARVLITFADPKSPPTKELFGLYFDGDFGIFGEYRTMAISTASDKLPQAEALAKQLGIVLPKEFPLIVAEDADGKVLGVLDRSALFDQKGAVSQDALRAFLTRYVVPRRDGQALFDAALAQAKRENKRVIADETAVWCGPCCMLASFMNENRRLWEKDYIWIKMDVRWPHAIEIMKSLRGKQGGGIPWVAILDADGKVIGRNLGFPPGDGDDGTDHFVEMFNSTAQRMTADDLSQLKKSLEAQPSDPVQQRVMHCM